MIAAALYVQTDQIKAAGPGRSEQKIANAADDLCIQFRRRVGRQIFEDRLYRHMVEDRGIEERIAQRHLVGDRTATVVQELDVITQQAMPEAKGGCGEFVA